MPVTLFCVSSSAMYEVAEGDEPYRRAELDKVKLDKLDSKSTRVFSSCLDFWRWQLCTARTAIIQDMVILVKGNDNDAF